MKPRFKKNIAAATICLLGFCATTQAALIISDNLEGNGDVSAIMGTISTAWAGWAFNTAASLYPDSTIVGVAPGFSRTFVPAGTNNVATATYGGTIAEGTYTISLQILNPNNGPFLNVQQIIFGGAATVATGTNAAPALGFDSIWTYELVVGSGSSLIGNNLTFAIDTSGAIAPQENMAVDQVDISFVAVPEPSSAALLGLGGLALILRRRK